MEEYGDQWCVVQGNFARGTYRKVKNFYVRQHFTRFIRQGFCIVESGNRQSLAAVNPEADTLTVVLLGGKEPSTHRISLPGASLNGGIQAWRTNETESMEPIGNIRPTPAGDIEVRLPEKSITTLVVPVKPNRVR
ncbi:MAG: hypothetical protein K5764_06150 [Prevotella sp.]|nr:hypothetical protein [Prevotella sp.]